MLATEEKKGKIKKEKQRKREKEFLQNVEGIPFFLVENKCFNYHCDIFNACVPFPKDCIHGAAKLSEKLHYVLYRLKGLHFWGGGEEEVVVEKQCFPFNPPCHATQHCRKGTIDHMLAKKISLRTYDKLVRNISN